MTYVVAARHGLFVAFCRDRGLNPAEARYINHPDKMRGLQPRAGDTIEVYHFGLMETLGPIERRLLENYVAQFKARIPKGQS